MEIRDIRKKDYRKAIEFAIKGMHFDMYLHSPFLQRLYGRYFWYLETNRATHVIAAYEGDTLAGVILAEMKGKEPAHYSRSHALYVNFFDLLQKVFFKDSAGLYGQTNEEMFKEFEKRYVSEGEIVFLAANPDIKAKGIGTFLLSELEKREKGKRIHLYTDDFCTYQFYEHRDFERVGEKEIDLELGKREVRMTCLLYSKVL